MKSSVRVASIDDMTEAVTVNTSMVKGVSCGRFAPQRKPSQITKYERNLVKDSNATLCTLWSGIYILLGSELKSSSYGEPSARLRRKPTWPTETCICLALHSVSSTLHLTLAARSWVRHTSPAEKCCRYVSSTT